MTWVWRPEKLSVPRKAGNLSCLASSGHQQWAQWAPTVGTNRKQIRRWVKTSSDLIHPIIGLLWDILSSLNLVFVALTLIWSYMFIDGKYNNPSPSFFNPPNSGKRPHTQEPPSSCVSKELEQKGAPPIERFHHPGTEPVTSSSVMKTCSENAVDLCNTLASINGYENP